MNEVQVVADIQEMLRQARQQALRSINTAMLQAYWLVGRCIVEEEQMGESRAAYGKALMKTYLENCKRNLAKGFYY